MPERFGERLHRLRLRRQLTLTELAHAVGVSESAVRQMEKGQTKSASFIVGVRLAKKLGVTAEYLALGTGVSSEKEPPAPDQERFAPLPAFEHALLQIKALDRRVKSVEAALRGGRRRKGPG